MIIERFFISIKVEIDREIQELQRKQKKKKEKRNLICVTDANNPTKNFSQSTVGSCKYVNARAATSHGHDRSFDSSSHHRNKFTTPSSHCYTPCGNESKNSYQQLPLQHGFETRRLLDQNCYTDYQSRCMDASGYIGEQSFSNHQGYNSHQVTGNSTKSDDSSHQSLVLTQTRSETEVRLAKLQYEVAGLVSRYQVAEDELQSVGHSMGGNSSSAHNSQHSDFKGNEVKHDEFVEVYKEACGERDIQEPSSSNHQFSSAINLTPPRAPLQHRLNHLHGVTPPRLSHSQKALLHHQRSNSLHAPVPMRYSLSNPNDFGRASPRIIQPPQSHIYNGFPPIPSASHSYQDSKSYLMTTSAEINSCISHHRSPMHPEVSSFRESGYLSRGQSPVNYSEEQCHPNSSLLYYYSGVPRTPSGRQF